MSGDRLLDTNAVIALIANDSNLLARLQGLAVVVPSVTLGEL